MVMPCDPQEPRLPKPLERFQIDSQLFQDAKEQRRANRAAAMDRNRGSSAVLVAPPLVTAGLACSLDPKSCGKALELGARALGMYDFGGVARQRSSGRTMFLFDQLKHLGEFSDGFFGRRHQRVATGNGRNLSHPTIRPVPIDHQLVVVKAHEPMVVRPIARAKLAGNGVVLTDSVRIAGDSDIDRNWHSGNSH